jgi:asparagine synthetase A
MTTALLSWNEQKFTHDQGIFAAFLAIASSKDNFDRQSDSICKDHLSWEQHVHDATKIVPRYQRDIKQICSSSP